MFFIATGILGLWVAISCQEVLAFMLKRFIRTLNYSLEVNHIDDDGHVRTTLLNNLGDGHLKIVVSGLGDDEIFHVLADNDSEPPPFIGEDEWVYNPAMNWFFRDTDRGFARYWLNRRLNQNVIWQGSEEVIHEGLYNHRDLSDESSFWESDGYSRSSIHPREMSDFDDDVSLEHESPHMRDFCLRQMFREPLAHDGLSGDVITSIRSLWD